MEAYLVPSIGSLAAFSRPVSLRLSGFFLALDLPSRALITIQKGYSNSGIISPEDLVQAQLYLLMNHSCVVRYMFSMQAIDIHFNNQLSGNTALSVAMPVLKPGGYFGVVEYKNFKARSNATICFGKIMPFQQ